MRLVYLLSTLVLLGCFRGYEKIDLTQLSPLPLPTDSCVIIDTLGNVRLELDTSNSYFINFYKMPQVDSVGSYSVYSDWGELKKWIQGGDSSFTPSLQEIFHHQYTSLIIHQYDRCHYWSPHQNQQIIYRDGNPTDTFPNRDNPQECSLGANGVNYFKMHQMLRIALGQQRLPLDLSSTDARWRWLLERIQKDTTIKVEIVDDRYLKFLRDY